MSDPLADFDAFHESMMEARSAPVFVSQRIFREMVILAERRGLGPRGYLPPGRLIIHPDALAWFGERVALARMQEHFGMLS